MSVKESQKKYSHWKSTSAKRLLYRRASLNSEDNKNVKLQKLCGASFFWLNVNFHWFWSIWVSLFLGFSRVRSHYLGPVEKPHYCYLGPRPWAKSYVSIFGNHARCSGGARVVWPRWSTIILFFTDLIQKYIQTTADAVSRVSKE